MSLPRRSSGLAETEVGSDGRVARIGVYSNGLKVTGQRPLARQKIDVGTGCPVPSFKNLSRCRASNDMQGRLRTCEHRSAFFIAGFTEPMAGGVTQPRRKSGPRGRHPLSPFHPASDFRSGSRRDGDETLRRGSGRVSAAAHSAAYVRRSQNWASVMPSPILAHRSG